MRRTHLWTALVGAAVFTPALHAGLAPFQVSGVFLDDSSFPVRGTGIFFDSDSYQVPFGNNFPPSVGNVKEFPELEFDSYVAFGGQPSTVNRAAIAPRATPVGFDENNGFFEGGSIGGAVLTGGGADGLSEINPHTGLESFFFARLVVPTDIPVTGLVGVDIVGEGGIEFYPVEIFDPNAVGGRGFREFRVVGQKTDTAKELPLFSAGRGTATGLFDVYDFYVELVPAPGAAALLGLSGLTLIRRRR